MSERVICRRCGAENAVGDQFCGSCGAFLEWEGEAAREPSARGTSIDGDTSADDPYRGRFDYFPPPPPPDPPPPEPTPPGTVACPACRLPNPIGRTFCQSCGTRLQPSPGSDAGGSPGKSTQPPAGTRRSSADGRRLPGWLPVVVGLGLVAGVAAVAVPQLLGSSAAPTSAATTAPTLTPTLTPTLAPSAAAASGSPTSPAPSVAPSADPVAITPTGATASSVVGNREMFDAAKAIDGRLDTSWQEGAAEEEGEWIEVTFAPATLEHVVVYAGYQLSRDAYLANRRPRDVLVSVDGGVPTSFRLADSEQPQRLDVPDVAGATRVRIEIVSTYDPQATAYAGSPFDDLAISEIRLFGRPAE